jgi:hypothetical protein
VGAVIGRGAEQVRRVLWASAPAWAMAAGATVLAAGLAATVPGDVPVLHGIPRIVAWASAVLVAIGLLTGGQRMAPLAVATLTLAAAAAIADEGGPVGATAIGIGVAGWLCLELTASSLEARPPRRRRPETVLRRVGATLAVTVGGALVGLAALTVATDVDLERAVLRSTGVLAAVALVGLVAWLASTTVRRR